MKNLTLGMECNGCGEQYQQAAHEWAYRDYDGAPANGFDGAFWYWTEPLANHATFKLYVEPSFGMAGQRCDVCVDKWITARERTSVRYFGDVPPPDFDPSYAGERWDEV